MSKKEYIWRIGDSPPPIKQHSIAKQEVYKRYIKKYINTLNSNPLIPNFKIVIVDAFAGGGEYLTEDNQHHNGSPVKVIEAVKETEKEINSSRTKQFTIQQKYFFLEKKKTNVDYLNKHLTNLEYDQYFDTEIIIQKGKFEELYRGVINKIHSEFTKKVRTIFILDQYGYTDAPFSIIREIFELLPNAEVILTIAVDHLIDYICNPECVAKQTLDLFGNNQKTIINTGVQLQKTLKEKMGLDLKELNNIKLSSPAWRAIIEHKITGKLQLFSGAKFYTPFFLSEKDSHRDMWLVHLSNHPEARNVMTEVHWDIANYKKTKMKHYGNTGLDMLGYKGEAAYKNSQHDMFSGDVVSFEDTTASKVIKTIMEEIPNNLRNAMSFSRFYYENANHTMAHKEHIRESFKQLLGMKELIVTGKNSEKRVSDVKDGDTIKLHPQKTFSFR